MVQVFTGFLRGLELTTVTIAIAHKRIRRVRVRIRAGVRICVRPSRASRICCPRSQRIQTAQRTRNPTIRFARCGSRGRSCRRSCKRAAAGNSAYGGAAGERSHAVELFGVNEHRHQFLIRCARRGNRNGVIKTRAAVFAVLRGTPRRCECRHRLSHGLARRNAPHCWPNARRRCDR
jgi:hypothetical protein